MPHFARSREEGSFQPLGTVEPAAEPGGVVDLRDRPRPGRPRHLRLRPPRPEDLPADLVGDAAARRSGHARSSSSATYPAARRRGAANNARRRRPSGTRCSRAGVDTEVYRMPGNYPRARRATRRCSPGMGTVDMRGGYGTYTCSPTARAEARATRRATSSCVTVQDDDLDGDARHGARRRSRARPTSSTCSPAQMPGAGDYLTAPRHRPARPRERHRAGRGGRLAAALLREGEWSDWMRASSFDALPGGHDAARGHRALLREGAPARASSSTPRR